MPQRGHSRDALFKNPGQARVGGRFLTVNGADSTNLVGDGGGANWTVARTAEGKWTITFPESYPALLWVTGSAMLASAAADAGDLVVHFDPVAADTALSTIVVYLSQDGTDSDVPGAWVQFEAVFRTTAAEK